MFAKGTDRITNALGAFRKTKDELTQGIKEIEAAEERNARAIDALAAENSRLNVFRKTAEKALTQIKQILGES